MGRLKKLAGIGHKQESSTGQEVVSRDEAEAAAAGGVRPFEIESRSQADEPSPVESSTTATGGGTESGMVEAPHDPSQDPFGVSGSGSDRNEELDLDDGDLEALGDEEDEGVADPFAVAPRSHRSKSSPGSAGTARPTPAADSPKDSAPAEAAPEAESPKDSAPAEAAPEAESPSPEQTEPAAEEHEAAEEPAAEAEAGSPQPRKRPARLRISYKKSSTFVREYERNLKRGGTFIKTKTPLEVGRECVLLLTVPDLDDTIAVRGSVVWSSLGVDDLQGQEEGMGIRYDVEDGQGMDSLKSALSKLSDPS